MKEIWVVIKGFDNYSISNFGNLKNNKTNRLRVQSKDSSGYACCTLSLKGKTYTKSIHRLVAETFIYNRFNKPQVNHKDGNKLNNRYDNLEWCTSSENLKHAYDTDLKVATKGEANGQSKLTAEQVKYIRENYVKYSREKGSYALARMFGVSSTTILDVIKEKNWKIS